MDQKQVVRAACTIVSFNYLPYARALCESLIRVHPDWKFYVLLVDRAPSRQAFASEKFETILVEELGIRDFPSVAFKYDILELNTNIKPTLLKYLFGRGVDQIIYFDPDIEIYSPLTPILEQLHKDSIVLIPHAASPNADRPRAEVELLIAGVFNLGFIALSKGEESLRFLKWWEDRCLNLAYDEPRTGLFVDQKWINLVPCFFENFRFVKHPGCNMAYWNLHERWLTGSSEQWTVNGSFPLVFFHYSGINVDGGDRISKFTDQFNLQNRFDLRRLFENYREHLVAHGLREMRNHSYAFGTFDNGERISKLMRAVYAGRLEQFGSHNPFDSAGPVYRWGRKHGLLANAGNPAAPIPPALEWHEDRRVRLVNAGLRLLLRIVGVDRYTLFLRYLGYISVLRNQQEIFDS